MDAHEEPLSPPGTPRERGLLHWLGLAPARSTDAPVSAEPSAPADPRHLARQQTLDEIGEFLLGHRLAITQATLAAAFDCTAGHDPRLAALVADRRASGEPITAEWLAEMRRAAAPEAEMKAMTLLMERLATNIESFTLTTVEARSATSEYQSALRSQVDELQAVNNAGAVMNEMVTIARTMIERTRAIELQMARSETETRALQHGLEEARRTAELDHLTGLPNRRAFENRIEKEVLAAKANREPLCVAFCDIDRFKRINATHGHEAGDRVLQVVARALNEISDERCHVARHGGEEFVVLFRGKTLAEAYAILDETREALAERRMVNRANDIPFGKVTFSAGIADIFEYPEPRAALRAADEALYVAKDEGRNRIVRAPARLTLVTDSRAA
ncbi:MAG: GGDEF domain-containing protein [Sphingomonadales bacterium]|nr:GGDEF domain-containing protein [Sphingomonadales bacterium]